MYVGVYGCVCMCVYVYAQLGVCMSERVGVYMLLCVCLCLHTGAIGLSVIVRPWTMSKPRHPHTNITETAP